MSEVAREALQRDLQRVRDFSRGSVTKFRVTFRCPASTCPVQEVRLDVLEERGLSKIFQSPNMCPRCRQELTAYVGCEARA
jgi:hypothetical protein